MVSTHELVQYLDDILETAAVPDSPNAVNGLQFANRGRVAGLAVAVDFSGKTVAAAAKAGSDMLLVHHGMFWSGARPLIGPAYDRIYAGERFGFAKRVGHQFRLMEKGRVVASDAMDKLSEDLIHKHLAV